MNDELVKLVHDALYVGPMETTGKEIEDSETVTAALRAHPDVVLRALGGVPVTVEPTDHSPTLAMTQHVQAADIIANAVAHEQFFDAWWIPRAKAKS